MLNTTVYNRLQAPGQILGVTTHIEVAMYIESMSTFRAQTMVKIIFMLQVLNDVIRYISRTLKWTCI